MDMSVALAMDQRSVADCPRSMVLGSAVKSLIRAAAAGGEVAAAIGPTDRLQPRSRSVGCGWCAQRAINTGLATEKSGLRVTSAYPGPGVCLRIELPKVVQKAFGSSTDTAIASKEPQIAVVV